jgi:hypothetical protein
MAIDKRVKIETASMKFCRNVTGHVLKDQIGNTRIRNEQNILNLNHRTHWFERLEPERIPQLTTDYTPRGTRLSPKLRCSDQRILQRNGTDRKVQPFMMKMMMMMSIVGLYAFQQILLDYQIKQMGETCSTRGRDDKCVQNWTGKPEE